MARLTRRQEGEITEYFYGIDRNFRVVSVSWNRGGVMTGPNFGTHYYRGPNPKSEVAIVFHLCEIESVSQVLFGSDHEKRIREELQKKADAMKAEAEKPV